MTTKISDNSGNGYGMKVDKENRAHTRAVTIPIATSAALDGNANNINTGLISITGDATLLYIKNNEDKTLVIEAIALGSFEGISHSDDPYITLIKKPNWGRFNIRWYCPRYESK